MSLDTFEQIVQNCECVRVFASWPNLLQLQAYHVSFPEIWKPLTGEPIERVGKHRFHYSCLITLDPCLGITGRVYNFRIRKRFCDFRPVVLVSESTANQLIGPVILATTWYTANMIWSAGLVCTTAETQQHAHETG